MAAEEVYSLLLPLAGTRLLVPNAVVAEVVGFSGANSDSEDGPSWLLGEITWQGKQVPVLSFEAMREGGRPAALNPRARVAILNCIMGASDLVSLGIVTEGHPHLVRVDRGILTFDDRQEPESDSPVLCRVFIANAEALIPNLEFIEKELAERIEAA